MTTYQVRLINKKRKIDVTIPVDDDVYILDAAEDNDIELPYTCRAGACSSCVGKIVEGEVDQEDQSFLEDEQMDKGFALLCTTYPRSDLTVKTHMEAYLI
ncbi:MAG: 2Fe-2S iron-sulfur cluster-binding protein [Cyanobacteria bacterium J06621_11]